MSQSRIDIGARQSACCAHHHVPFEPHSARFCAAAGDEKLSSDGDESVSRLLTWMGGSGSVEVRSHTGSTGSLLPASVQAARQRGERRRGRSLDEPGLTLPFAKKN